MMISKADNSVLFFCMCMTCLLTGCSNESDSPERFDLSGAVSFNGEPVPYGEILFLPDNSKGNQGAGAVATIEAGKYQTQVGKGVTGGPHRIQIQGFDAPPISGAVPAGDETAPKPLFRKQEFEVDFPRESSTYNFDIPSN